MIFLFLFFIVLSSQDLYAKNETLPSPGNLLLADALIQLQKGNIPRAIDQAKGVFKTSLETELLATDIHWPYQKKPRTVRYAADLLLRKIDKTWRRIFVEGSIEGEIDREVQFDLLGADKSFGRIQTRILDSCKVKPGTEKDFQLSFPRVGYNGFPVALRMRYDGVTQFYEIEDSRNPPDQDSQSVHWRVFYTLKIHSVGSIVLNLTSPLTAEATRILIRPAWGINTMEWQGNLPAEQIVTSYPKQLRIVVPTPDAYQIVLTNRNGSTHYRVVLKEGEVKEISLPKPSKPFALAVDIPQHLGKRVSLNIWGTTIPAGLETELISGKQEKVVGFLPPGRYAINLETEISNTSIKVARYLDIPESNITKSYQMRIRFPKLHHITGKIIAPEELKYSWNDLFFTSSKLHLELSSEQSQDLWAATFSTRPKSNGEFDIVIPNDEWVISWSEAFDERYFFSERMIIKPNNTVLVLNARPKYTNSIRIHVSDKASGKILDGATVVAQCPTQGFYSVRWGNVFWTTETGVTKNGVAEIKKWDVEEECFLFVTREGYINSDILEFDLIEPKYFSINLEPEKNETHIKINLDPLLLEEKVSLRLEAMKGHRNYVLYTLFATGGDITIRGLRPGTYLFRPDNIEHSVREGERLVVTETAGNIEHTVEVGSDYKWP